MRRNNGPRPLDARRIDGDGTPPVWTSFLAGLLEGFGAFSLGTALLALMFAWRGVESGPIVGFVEAWAPFGLAGAVVYALATIKDRRV